MFPHVMQPLHVFEPRYRDLLEDALAGDRLIAMAMLTPGWERNYEGRPALYPMACLGRITAHFRLGDGTYNVLLLGLQRVKVLRELQSVRPFREADVKLYADRYPACSVARQENLQERLHDLLFKILPTLPEAQEQLDQLLGNDVPLGVLTDVISYMLDIDPARKQSLLNEVNVYRRTELLLSRLTDATALADAEAAAGFPPAFSTN